MFKFTLDEQYFVNLLSGGNIKLFKLKHYKMFDFRNQQIKRKEYNKIKKAFFVKLWRKYHGQCQLKIHPDCSKNGKLVLDHIIPLGSNELSKKLRKMKSVGGKKVPSQSFGSNHISNLTLSCERCNAAKKHKIILSKNFQI